MGPGPVGLRCQIVGLSRGKMQAGNSIADDFLHGAQPGTDHRRAAGRGRPWQDPRAMLNGILWVLGTGVQWRELPKKYPPYQTCHRRFQQWVREGKLECILRALAEELHARG